MEQLNIIEEQEMAKKVDELKVLIEKIETSFNNMNTLINDTVSANIGVWDGEAANQFKSSWENVSIELPSFVNMLNTQVNNIEITIDKTVQSNDE